jgi:hypothetical protein
MLFGIGRHGQNNGQGAGPKRIREFVRGFRKHPPALGRCFIRNMNDQGIGGGAALGRVQGGDGFGVCGIRGQSINRFRGDDHKGTRVQGRKTIVQKQGGHGLCPRGLKAP